MQVYYRNLFRLISILILLSLTFITSIYAQCFYDKYNLVKVCLSESCAVNKICNMDIFFNSKNLIFIPSSEDYILLYDHFSKIINKYGIVENKSPLRIGIVAFKENVTLHNFIVNNRIVSVNVVIPKELKTSQANNTSAVLQQQETDEIKVQKIIQVNLIYLVLVGISFLSLIAYQIYITTLEKKHGEELEKIVYQTEKELKEKENKNNKNISGNEDVTENNSTNNLEVTKLHEFPIKIRDFSRFSSQQDQRLELKKDFEYEVIRKAIISAKLKGLPKELIVEHLSRKYNPKKVEMLIKQFY